MLGKSSLIFALLFFADVSLGKLFPLDGKVINGTETSITGNEHIISLRLRKKDWFFGSGFICGGSIIAKNAILTAAHCLWDADALKFRRADEFIVAMGSADRFDMDNSFRFDVTHYVKMETFNITSYKDDMAILFLDKYIPDKTPTVKIINLEDKFVNPNSECNVTGWGDMGGGLGTSAVLMTAKVPIIDDQTCSTNYEDMILDGMLCAGYMAGGTDACNGDSGGPLVCDKKLVGVVSTGYQCALEGFPGIYANVSFYRPWILKNLQSNSVIRPKIGTSFQVSIRIQAEDYFSGRGHICSGSLLSNETVLTAASCLYDIKTSKFREPDELVVAVGMTNIFDPEPEIEVYHLNNYTILPGFNATDKSNDMAILFINLTKNNDTKFIERQTTKLPTGTTCFVTGWGSPKDDHENDNIASLEVSILDKSECSDVNGSICTKLVQDGTSACSIDPGSPLICGGKIAGVAVKGLGCDSQGLSTTFYSDVESNEEWIKKFVKDGSNSLTVSLFVLVSSFLLSYY
ncbi:hypothetical protein ACFFRR_001996 [Megaselia abdita]